jgi:hypothetical protein
LKLVLVGLERRMVTAQLPQFPEYDQQYNEFNAETDELEGVTLQELH